MYKGKHFGLRIEEELLKKFRYVCKYNDRSANKQILNIIRKYVDKFEKEHGEIILDEDKGEE